MKIHVFFFLLMFSGVSLAADGNFILLKGDVKINNQVANQKMPISFGDNILVGKDSYAILKIKPGTILKLKPSTSINIAQPKKGKKLSRYNYILKFGEIFVKAKRTKKNRYKVLTRDAVLGVRGTVFFTSYSKEKQETWMCVNEGAVHLKSKINDKKATLVKAGEGVLVKKDSPLKAKKYKWTKSLNWNFSGDLESVKDTVDIKSINYNLNDIEYE